MFGQSKWDREFVNDMAMDERALCLRGLSTNQIQTGLNSLRGSGRAWIPITSEFREMCLGNAKQKTWGEIQVYIAEDTWFSTPVACHIANTIGFYKIGICIVQRLRVGLSDCGGESTLFLFQNFRSALRA